MTTVEILEMKPKNRQEGNMTFKEKARANEKVKQPRFFCSNCNHEIFLCMLYCDECGGEIAWPEKYKTIIPKEKERKKND